MHIAKTQNNFSSFNINTFKSKSISIQAQKYYTEALALSMQDRPSHIQGLYKNGIDFINGKINKTEYLKKMRNLVNEIYLNPKELNSEEKFVVDDLKAFFDIFGDDTSKISYTKIAESLNCII